MADQLLQSYLETPDPGEADSSLGALIFQHAVPLLNRIVSRRLGESSRQDVDDIVSDVTLSLISRLKALKSGSGGEIIRSFESYVAAAAHNGCDQYLRQRYPERHRLKNRLRYLIGKHPKFALWEDSASRWVCGLELWKQRPTVAALPDLMPHLSSGVRPERLLEDLFRASGAPLEFDGVVDWFARIWGVRDHSQSSELPDDLTASESRGPDVLMVETQSLHGLWNEIMALPAPQKTALLLNLRDPGGGSALWLFASAAIVSVRKIADAMEWPVEEFAQVWPKLPLSDFDIAERLSVTRQQVINLRQAARQRLARRFINDRSALKAMGKSAS